MTKFEREINIAVSKYAKGLIYQDKEDLRQEARIVILQSGTTDAALAYKLARDRIIDVLRKRPPREEDIDKPSVRRLAEKARIHFPDIDGQLDAQKAAILTSRLPAEDAVFIQNLFGIDCEPHTSKQLAKVWGKSEDWVDRNKKRILAKLKIMLTGDKD